MGNRPPEEAVRMTTPAAGLCESQASQAERMMQIVPRSLQPGPLQLGKLQMPEVAGWGSFISYTLQPVPSLAAPWGV